MKAYGIIGLLVFSISLQVSAQQDTSKTKKKLNMGQTIENLPDMLLNPPDKAADSAMYYLKNDNFSMLVWPLWQEHGLQTGDNLKITKVNDDPLDKTFPLPEKKMVNDLIITLA